MPFEFSDLSGGCVFLFASVWHHAGPNSKINILRSKFPDIFITCGRSLSQSRNKGNEGVLGNLEKDREMVQLQCRTL